MPVEIIWGFPCKNCGGKETNAHEETVFYWVEVNHLLREEEEEEEEEDFLHWWYDNKVHVTAVVCPYTCTMQ